MVLHVSDQKITEFEDNSGFIVRPCFKKQHDKLSTRGVINAEQVNAWHMHHRLPDCSLGRHP